MSKEKKISLNLKIKEKISTIGSNNENLSNKFTFHHKNKSDGHSTNDENQFIKIYTTGKKIKGFNKDSKIIIPNGYTLNDRARKSILKTSLNNPLQEKKVIDSDFSNTEQGKRSTSLALLQSQLSTK